MGSITSVLWTFLASGDEVIVDKTLYGCTFAFMQHGLSKFGITITHVDMTNPENLIKAMNANTKIVYFETPANPNMRLVDIAAISLIAKAGGARVVVDNTYATPLLTRPLELGADIVVHSATKYLGGHGDLVAGLVVGNMEDVTRIRMEGMKDMTGSIMAPFNAMLITRGLKTLELRIQRHCENAMIVARQLEAHQSVEKVYFPGLESFEQHKLAKRQMANFGGMIAFEVAGGMQGGIDTMNRLKMIQRAVSLGEAIKAAGRIGNDRRDVGVMAVTSADRLNAGWHAAVRMRKRGFASATSHIERMMGLLPTHCLLITVIDGHPATLSWIGGVGGHRTVPLGVEHFGQTGTVSDLYRHFGIDANAIVAAADELSAGRKIGLSMVQ